MSIWFLPVLLAILFGFSSPLNARTIVKFKEGSVQALQLKIKGMRYLPALELGVMKNSLSKGTEGVEFQEEDQPIRIAALPDDTLITDGMPIGWSDDLLNISSAWQRTTGDPLLTIAVLDTGIDMAHKDLHDNIWRNPAEIPSNGIDDDGNGYVDDVNGYDFVNDDPDPSDDSGHGTHVAGVIGALGGNNYGIAGLNWHVRLLPLKIADDDGNGTTSAVLEAIDYAVRNGARIVNASWVVTAQSDGSISLDGLHSAFATLEKKEILLATAAGNASDGISGRDLKDEQVYPANFRMKNFLVVAAADTQGKLVDQSNFGSDFVDLAAPGHMVLSTYPDDKFVRMSGTSVATAFVSGAAGLILSMHPEWGAQRVVQALKTTVRPVEELKGRVITAGVMDIDGALAWQAPAGTVINAAVTESKDLNPVTAAAVDSKETKIPPVPSSPVASAPPSAAPTPSRAKTGGCSLME